MKRDIIIVVLFLASLTLAVFLFRTNTGIKAREMTSDIDMRDPQSLDNKFVPRVYELVYVKRDSNDQNIWLFLKGKEGTTGLFVKDVKDKKINHALIFGRFYKLEYITDDKDFYYIKMTDKCMESKMFLSCKESIPISTSIASVLHVLGYYFL